MFRKLFLIAAFVAICILLTNELNAEFKVIAKKGSISSQSSKSSGWSELKIGSVIADNDFLKVSENSYVLLYFSNGRTIEFSKAGSYKMDEFAKKAKIKNGLDFRFSEYIIKEFNEGKGIIREDSEKKKKYVPGGIERSIELDCKPLPPKKDKQRQYLFLKYPKTGVLIGGNIEFAWNEIPGTNKYILKIINNSGEEIFKKECQSNSLVVNTNELNLRSDQCYNWNVSSNDLTSESNCISVLSETKVKALNDTISKIRKETRNLTEASQNLIIASFYADRNIPGEAIKFFRELIAIEPDNSDYRIIFSNYLFRQGYPEEAEKVYKY